MMHGALLLVVLLHVCLTLAMPLKFSKKLFLIILAPVKLYSRRSFKNKKKDSDNISPYICKSRKFVSGSALLDIALAQDLAVLVLAVLVVSSPSLTRGRSTWWRRSFVQIQCQLLVVKIGASCFVSCKQTVVNTHRVVHTWH